jgi:hypothetical protein
MTWSPVMFSHSVKRGESAGHASLSDLKKTNFGILNFGILEIHGLCELGP